MTTSCIPAIHYAKINYNANKIFSVAALQSWIQYDANDFGNLLVRSPHTTIANGASILEKRDAFFNSNNKSINSSSNLANGYDYKDKVVVITGAGGLICGMMARAFAQCGAKVAALDLNEEAVKKLAKMVEEALRYNKVESILDFGEEEDIFSPEFFEKLSDIKMPASKLEMLVKMLNKTKILS